MEVMYIRSPFTGLNHDEMKHVKECEKICLFP